MSTRTPTAAQARRARARKRRSAIRLAAGALAGLVATAGLAIGRPLTTAAAGPGAASPTMAASAGPRGSITATVAASPLSVTLRLSTTTAPVGRTFAAYVDVANVSGLRLSGLSYRFLADAAAFRVVGPIGGSGSLGPHGRATAAFLVCVRSPGGYVVQGWASATVPGGTAFEAVSPARVIVVRPKSHGTCG